MEDLHDLSSRWIVRTQCWDLESPEDEMGGFGESTQSSQRQMPNRPRVPAELLV